MFFIEDHYLAAAVGLVAAPGVLWFYWFRYWHIGFGVVLERRKSDGTVWVTARLLYHPADKAGIKKASRLVAVNGHHLVFSSHEEFAAWFKASKPKLGKEEHWLIEHGGVTTAHTMKPTIVRTKIPVRWDPNYVPPSEPKQQQGRVRGWQENANLRFCNKTGDLLVRYSPR